MSFISAIFHYDFLQNAVLTALLASAVCAVIGSYTVIRRSSYMVGAVSHSLLGGIGLARYCQVMLGIACFTPFLGAVLTSLIVSAIITAASAKSNYREDTLLSAIWTVGTALGLCFIMMMKGYSDDLNAYLFGNILLISRQQLFMMMLLDFAVLLFAWLFHNRFIALFFNIDILLLKGISIFRTNLLLNILTGLTVVLLSQAVGVVLAVALMTLPPATALRLTKRLPVAMLLAALLCLLECTAGIFASYVFDWPASAIIILAAAILHIAVACLKKIF